MHKETGGLKKKGRRFFVLVLKRQQIAEIPGKTELISAEQEVSLLSGRAFHSSSAILIRGVSSP